MFVSIGQMSLFEVSIEATAEIVLSVTIWAGKVFDSVVVIQSHVEF